jgi:hypothetical protein
VPHPITKRAFNRRDFGWPAAGEASLVLWVKWPSCRDKEEGQSAKELGRAPPVLDRG